MAKVKEYFQELENLGLISTPEPTEEEMVVEEPTDAELAEIEYLIENEFYLD
tara:strand:- start:1354 stop:1509 length:156 start_codon:yes stop_codon:yes gene_type:complete